MKHLYLVRHAKSSKDIPAITDIERPLNERGLRDSREMGQRLRKQGVKVDAIYCSPAIRALHTARRVAVEIGFPAKKIQVVKSLYHADIPTVMKAIKKASDLAGSAMFFGHNPEFLDLANYLTPRMVIKFPTSGVLAVDFAVDSWKKITKKCGELVFFDYPKKEI